MNDFELKKKIITLKFLRLILRYQALMVKLLKIKNKFNGITNDTILFFWGKYII